uniref:Ribosomal protein S3 n=1 Tax=Synarthrophyton chejuense TaxID=2485825 RepID=A0A3G3MII8_9FLOR|nr:ribosomal protein S3 [Synarthrophyton chejuense]AYR06651.1 ribosomal protein S3 [Synarthrophyton chejuense]
MSQKINPISFKLGTLQFWPTAFSKYGKNFKYYSNTLKIYSSVRIYIILFLIRHKIFLDGLNIKFFHKKVFININIFSLNKINNFFNLKYLIKVIYYWIKLPVIINFYNKSSLTNSSFLIINYLTFLIKEEESVKKILQNIYKIFKEHSGNYKLIYTSKGIKKVKFKGFKLKFSGCFETSRSQMAKSIKYNFGPLSLTGINNYTEYSYKTFYTKFGSCGLKIWLFYEFKSL